MTEIDAVTAAVEAAKSSPVVKAADAIGQALVPCECGDSECDGHACTDCYEPLPWGETGVCRHCYRADPMNDPRADEDRS